MRDYAGDYYVTIENNNNNHFFKNVILTDVMSQVYNAAKPKWNLAENMVHSLLVKYYNFGGKINFENLN